jgi:hypothetical protein
MKHIKTYQLFESIDTLIKDFQDILLEIQDNGFNVQVKKGDHHAYSKCIEITISKDGGDFDFWTDSVSILSKPELTPFKLIEAKEDIIRLLEYANSQEWYSFNFEIITSSNTLKGRKFTDSTYKSSVEIEGDEIVVPPTSIFSTEKKEPISDDEKILCVYIGLGK